jgi:hypothetical protein
LVLGSPVANVVGAAAPAVAAATVTTWHFCPPASNQARYVPSLANETAEETFGVVLWAIVHGWHWPAEQVPGAQEWPQAPQLFVSVFRSRHALPHWERPVLHDHPQVAAVPAPVQVALAPEGGVQGEHDAPHVSGLVSSAQIAEAPAPHVWNPALHDQAHA